MDSSSYKDYHHELYDPKAIMDTYHDPKNKMFFEALVIKPNKMLQEALSSGLLKGDKMIDLVGGPIIAHLFLLSQYFKEITILDSSDASITEIEKWLRNDPDAVDWSHVAKHMSSLTGSTWKEEQNKVREAVKKVVKCDFSKNNPVEPAVLDLVDCVYSVFYLEAVSKDRESFIANMKKVCSLLNVGGCLAIFVPINITYYMIGEHKYFMLPMDSNFVQKAIIEAGFSIVTSELYTSKIKSDLCDQTHIFFAVAVKK